jgi:hypothetical protein
MARALLGNYNRLITLYGRGPGLLVTGATPQDEVEAAVIAAHKANRIAPGSAEAYSGGVAKATAKPASVRSIARRTSAMKIVTEDGLARTMAPTTEAFALVHVWLAGLTLACLIGMSENAERTPTGAIASVGLGI